MYLLQCMQGRCTASYLNLTLRWSTFRLKCNSKLIQVINPVYILPTTIFYFKLRELIWQRTTREKRGMTQAWERSMGWQMRLLVKRTGKTVCGCSGTMSLALREGYRGGRGGVGDMRTRRGRSSWAGKGEGIKGQSIIMTSLKALEKVHSTWQACKRESKIGDGWEEHWYILKRQANGRENPNPPSKGEIIIYIRSESWRASGCPKAIDGSLTLRMV